MGFQVEPDVLALLKQRNEITDQIATLQAVKKNLDDRLIKLAAETHGDYLSFRYGDSVVRIKPSYSVKIKPESINEVMGFLQGHGELARLARFDALRIGQVKELAGDHYRVIDPETGEIRQGWSAMVEDHFEQIEGEHEVAVMPLERAPQFLQRLPEGEGMER
jgi:hypothetical protein